MSHPGDSPNSGWAKMYTGRPSKPGKTQQQIGYGLVEGDGVGYVDNGDSKGDNKIKYGSVDGKRRKVETELEES